MGDYIIDLGSLEGKNSDLSNIKTKTNSIYDSYSGDYLSRLSGTEISAINTKIKNQIDRLNKGVNNCDQWFTRYLKEANQLEDELASFSGSLGEPVEFKGQFVDMFGKVTMPYLKTNATLDDYYALASMQTGGHIEEGKFTASNGVTMKYYVYIPEFSNGQTSGLPITVYLHGDSGYKHGVQSSSLPKLLTKGGLNVPGIVVMPQSNKDRWWESPRNMDTAAELVNYLAGVYRCDKTRISACGHSNGGCGVHHMVAAHPDIFASYFSSAGATGKNKKFEAIGKNHVYSWGIHGTKDKNVDFTNKNGVGGKETYERLKAVFPEGTEFTVLEGRDHFIQDEVWTTKYNYKGKMITPIDWLFTTKKYGSTTRS